MFSNSVTHSKWMGVGIWGLFIQSLCCVVFFVRVCDCKSTVPTSMWSRHFHIPCTTPKGTQAHLSLQLKMWQWPHPYPPVKDLRGLRPLCSRHAIWTMPLYVNSTCSLNNYSCSVPKTVFTSDHTLYNQLCGYSKITIISSMKSRTDKNVNITQPKPESNKLDLRYVFWVVPHFSTTPHCKQSFTVYQKCRKPILIHYHVSKVKNKFYN